MAIVVKGSAMISPKKPNITPKVDNDSSIIAGLSPIFLPIMRGTKKASADN